MGTGTISNFRFPRVTVRQEFTGTNVGTDATLPVVVIGPQYNIQTYEDQGEDLNIGDYVTTGLANKALPNKTEGSIVQTKSVKARMPEAVLQLYSGTTGITATTGYTNRIDVANVLFAGDSRTAAVADDIVAGDGVILGVTVGEQTGTIKATVTGVTTASSTNGQLILSETLPTGVTISSLKVTREFDVILASTYVTFTLASNLVSIAAGAQASFTNVDDVVKTVDVLGGAVYMQYRERLTTYKNKLGVVASGDYSVSACKQIFGDCTTDNPLGLAVLLACLQAGGNYVYFTSVSQDTVTEYQQAMDFIGKDDTTYSVVILNETKQIVQACLASVNEQSDRVIPMYKILWYGISNPDAVTLVEKLVPVAVTTSGSTTVIEFAQGALADKGIKVGDIVKSNFGTEQFGDTKYDTFNITAFDVAASTVTVDATQTGITTADTCTIGRVSYSNTELADSIISRKWTADRRATAVYADDAVYGGEQLQSYYVAAAAAGMRSKEQPHRPLSNMSYNSVQVAEAHGLGYTALTNIASHGIWIVANNVGGTPINKRQLTTAAADDINYDEQSLTTNVDSICLNLKSVGADMVGNSNISPALISKLDTALNLRMTAYLQTKQSVQVGPQLLSYEIVQLYQDPVVLDKVVVHITGQPPKPFNELDITFNLV